MKMTSKTENCDGFLSGLADQIEFRQAQAKAQSRVGGIAPTLLAKAFRGTLVRQDPKGPVPTIDTFLPACLILGA